MPSLTVICPLNSYSGAERALPSAYDAAMLLHAPLELFSAVEIPESAERRLEYLQNMASTTHEALRAGPSTSVVVDTHAPRAIAARAASPNIVTVMATSTVPLMHTGYVGSAAERVARDAHNPVVLVGPHAKTRLGDVDRVVVPCDGSALSERIQDEAVAWSRRLDVPLWFVTAISPEVQARSGYSLASEANYVRGVASRVHADWDVLHGSNPGKAIVDWAGNSLIAMTTHGRQGLSRLAFGSVATSITRWSTAPVLVSNGGPGRNAQPDDATRDASTARTTSTQ